MSVENRSSSALFKRAEQLKRWEESDTNRESGTPRNKSKKIQFSLECVFLAACASGDKEEVLKLLNVGADIDTSNVDGLSALHQACIDDNLDMVEFLVEHGADINKGDNEGWTPLHATASCGFLSIAKYLIEQGADIAAVNNDGELAVDIAECDVMEDLLHTVLKEKGIDLEEARNKEENVMLQHAKEWLNSDKYEDIPHEKTGATALHVAASKGYIKVMDTLIQAGADVNAQDFDGWTPLHAAAHWGQKEACEILVENFCDMDKKNYVGQTAFDVSEGEMVRLLEELRKKQNSLQKDRSDINAMANRKEPHSPKRRLSMNDKPSPVKEKDNISEKQSLGQLIMEEDVPPVDKVPKVELKIETESDDKRKIADENNDKNTHVNNDVKPKLRNVPETPAKVPNNSVPSSPSRSANENDDVHVPSWRKPTSFRNAIKPPRFEDEKLWSNTAASSESVAANDDEESNITLLRRTQSFEADDKFYRRYCELKAKIESGNTHPALIPPPTNNTGSLPTRSASLKERARKKLMNDEAPLLLTFASTPTCTTTSTGNAVPATAQEIVASTASGVPGYRNSTAQLVRSGNKNLANNVNLEQTTMSAPTTPIANKLSPGNIFKNFFKSFVPPVRDEESETQRKAHAKRVRETRRSTQGVTLEEIKSAEQLVKKKQQQQLQLASTQLNSSTPTSDQTFMLEDARRGDKDGEAVNENVTRWTTSQSSPNEATDTATVTLPLRKPNKLTEDGEPDKDDNQEAKSVPTQAANPRRKRPKRRSTGAVQFDNEEDNEKLNSAGDTNEIVDNESGNGDKSGRSSRLSSASSIADEELTNNNQCNASSPSENGELDYKKLYEETLVENERLREKLRKTEDDLTDCRLRLTDSSSSAANKNSLSEIEKREKRAMERKLSEMEEELKQIEQIKQENQRLKDENGALIRVISKLSK